MKSAKAHWVVRDTIAWMRVAPSDIYRLYYSATGDLANPEPGEGFSASYLPLVVNPTGLPAALVEKFPFLKGATALKISDEDLPGIPALLKGELLVARMNELAIAEATSLQIAGVLDDLFYFDGELGAQRTGDQIRFRLWAPTARSVRLFVYDDPDGTQEIYPMIEGESGVWETRVGDPGWLNRKYYLYEVTVFSRFKGQIVTNVVTDPYSLGLAPDSLKSLVVDLNSAASKPDSWDLVSKPALASPTDIVLYELHVRDFSIFDRTVPEKDRGKYAAFNHVFSDGMLHLWNLASAGLTHLHLLPVFDFTSIPELSEGQELAQIDQPIAAPDSTEPQRAIAAVKDRDGYNWGYDPYHYGTPEGSYSTGSMGVTRTREFRGMVDALHLIGLRVVMDVVYNHTAAAGENLFSVLDRVVPGYYYRLDPNGDFYTSTCCPNTASERRMFFKLMLDTLKTWAQEYRVDGFRFDLMGFHFKGDLLEIANALHKIDPTIYLYGEGWDFGEVAGNALGENATQANMAGTGIGTFNDRFRDAVRGGGAFDRGGSLVVNQGFINGLWYDRNELGNGNLQQLLEAGDLVKLALAGTSKNYQFVDQHGALIKGSQIVYRGQPAGYGRDPSDVINYISAHDNQTLFDNNQYKLPIETSLSDRVRVNNLGLALVALAQGIPFFHAGDELLRSKSFDRNSYNSGDWFNRLDWTYGTNNFAAGLPPEWDNQPDWPVMKPFLNRLGIKPGRDQICSSYLYFQDLLRIRKSTRLFRLPTGEEIRKRVKFYNTGPNQQPALVVMAILNRSGGLLGAQENSVVVLFNVHKLEQRIDLPDYLGIALELHPVLRHSSADPLVKDSRYDSSNGSFVVPPRTAAIFVERP